MAEGWHQRFLPPLYALAITFVLVFVTGAALENPTTPTNSTPVRFIVSVPPSGPGFHELPEVLQDVHLRLGAPGVSGQLADVPLGRVGSFVLPLPVGDLQVCLDLPRGWTADRLRQDRVGGQWCERLPTPHSDVTILLHRGS